MYPLPLISSSLSFLFSKVREHSGTLDLPLGVVTGSLGTPIPVTVARSRGALGTCRLVQCYRCYFNPLNPGWSPGPAAPGSVAGCPASARSPWRAPQSHGAINPQVLRH